MKKYGISLLLFSIFFSHAEACQQYGLSPELAADQPRIQNKVAKIIRKISKKHKLSCDTFDKFNLNENLHFSNREEQIPR